jgi:outer membrane protein assembly factor BamB
MMGKKPDWLDDDDLFEDDDSPSDDSPKNAPVLKRGGAKRDAPPAAPRGRRDRDDEPVEEEEVAKKPSPMARLALPSKRPGEQEIAKSPVVIALAAGIAILTVLSGTYYFMIGRDVVSKEFTAIEEDISQQRFAQAIEKLDGFLIAHGRHERADEAKFLRAKTRLDRQIVGSVPDWSKGLEMVDLYIKDCRDLEGYPEKKPELLDYSIQIALGSLKTASDMAKSAKNATALELAAGLLVVSDTVALNIDGFAAEDEPPTKEKGQIKLAREDAEREIHKRGAIHKAYALIEGHLTGKRPIPALKARRDLIVQYSDMEHDRKLVGFLDEALNVEKSLIKKEDLDRAASTEDRPLPVPPPLSLTPHTRSSTEEASEGRNVFGVAHGCCYGVDSVTGDTTWRRAIGPDTPFFPEKVDTTIPGLLLFDTRWQELVLLNRQTGELGWRQTIEEPVSGMPLIHDGQVYLPTLGKHLYKIDLQTGQVTARLTFSQPVYAPPVLVRDSSNLIVAGDEGVTYVVGLRQMECIAVWPTFQPPGSIDVPLIAMGSLVLMAENGASQGCTLRVFDATDVEKVFPEVGTKVISTQVRDPLLLRGNKLFVPAFGEQFSAFTVSDNKEQEPLLDIARPPARSEYDGAVYLLGGPDGRLWSSSDTLRKFQLTQDDLPEDNTKKPIEFGATAQPLQKIGDTLFVGKRELGSDAVSLVQVNGEEMTEFGKTVLGTGVLAVMPTGDDSVLCLTRTGELFQVTSQQLETGGFMFRSDGQLKIPKDAVDPIRAGVLPGNQIAVTCGGKTPQLWIVNKAGKLAQELTTTVGGVLDPVPLAGGAVVALPTKLQLLGMPGGLRAADFLGIVEQQDTVQWASIVPIDEQHILVTDLAGNISRVEYRTNPKPHLQSIETLEVGATVHVSPVVAQGRLVVSDATGRTQLLDIVGFRQEAEVKLSAPAFGALAIVGDRLFVQSEDEKLRCLALDRKLEEVWAIEMGEDAMSGSPFLDGDSLIVGTMNGRVLTLNAETGEETKALQLDQPIEHGPFRLGSHLVVISIDGSLYRIESPSGEGS